MPPAMLGRMKYVPSAETADLFDRTWTRVARAAAFLARQLPAGPADAPASPTTRRLVRAELRLLEALMRRLLVLLAMTMTVPARAARAPAGRRKGSPAAGPKARRTHAPRFILFEPLGRPAPETPRRGIKGPMPRIRSIDIFAPAPLPQAAENTPALRPDAALARRLAALQDALDRPGRQVARMARRLAALHAGLSASETAPKRLYPFRETGVPGTNRKREGARSADIFALHAAALRASALGFIDTG